MSASITARTGKHGRRFVVRYRLGGRAYAVQHGGSFATMKEARARRDLVAGEIAAGRDPRILLDALLETPAVRTFADWAKAYRSSRIDLGTETRKNTGSHVLAMRVFAERDPARITTSDVQEWVAALTLKPSSVRRYIATLRSILDFAGVDPNPARDDRVRLPRQESVPVEPPSAGEVEAIIANAPQRHRLAVRTLAETGMRVGELCALAWGDVDEAGSRFRVKTGKTAAARRWVIVPAELMVDVCASTPPDDRTADCSVFGTVTPRSIGNVVTRACRSAGIAHYPARPQTSLCQRPNRSRSASDDRRRATRPLQELDDAGRLFARPNRRRRRTVNSVELDGSR
jgi:integrase